MWLKPSSPRAMDEESDSSDEELSLMSSESLHASSRQRASRIGASTRATTSTGLVREEVDRHPSVPARSSSATPAPSVIHVHVSQSRRGTPASSRQATPQPSSSAPPETYRDRGRSQKSPASDFPCVDDLSSLLEHRRITRSVSRSSLNIEPCRSDTPGSAVDKDADDAYRTAPVVSHSIGLYTRWQDTDAITRSTTMTMTSLSTNASPKNASRRMARRIPVRST